LVLDMKKIITDRRVLLIHLLLWVFYLSYRLTDFPGYLGLTDGSIYVGTPLLFYVIISYIHYFYLLPIWLTQKKISLYGASLALLLGVGLTIQVLVENGLFAGFGRFTTELTIQRALRLVWNASIFILFTSMIKVVIERFQFESKQQQLENEKLVTELNYLKAQINPHFLFNTLHNLNSLIYSQSKNAAEVIVKLSNIMRYMIYDSAKESVGLKEEIEYMNDYIHLESIRLNESFRVEMNITGDVELVQIAPLILFPFLENAFKHGVSDQEDDCWITSDIEVKDGFLKLRVRNKKIKLDYRREKSGFGLENLKRRLQLSYGDRHDLRIFEDESLFDVQLQLKV
jgi:hypothetical protein